MAAAGTANTAADVTAGMVCVRQLDATDKVFAPIKGICRAVEKFYSLKLSSFRLLLLPLLPLDETKPKGTYISFSKVQTVERRHINSDSLL